MGRHGISNVITLPVITRLDIPVERVIDGIPKNLESVIVLGFEEDGTLYVATSSGNLQSVFWELEKAKKRLLEFEDE